MSQDPRETDDLRDRVRRVLEEAEERSASLDSDAAGDEAADAFGDLPGRANKLVLNADPAELLDAVSSEELPEGEPPETVVDAIERSDPETLLELRKLLTLSRMAREEDENAVAEHVETFRELSRKEEEEAVENDETEGSDEEGETEEATETGETEEATEEPSTEEAEAETEEAEAEAEAGASDPDEGTDGADRLRKALLSGVEGLREEVRTARGELGDDEPGAEDEDEGEEDEGEEDESEGAGRERRSGGSDGTMFSTVPSRNRADMRGPSRFSTVRRK